MKTHDQITGGPAAEMTWLDECAMDAMNGLLSNPNSPINATPEECATVAYRMAAAMLAEKRRLEAEDAAPTESNATEPVDTRPNGMPDFDWSKVPVGYDWVAVDADGEGYAYTQMPKVRAETESWSIGTFGNFICAGFREDLAARWETTLTRRQEATV